ncbi:protein translocase subunit SecD [Ilumatobacter nonamiensis]|uniref:protein translocase subunit SecD n=1 Tax=Ilumatobacter nonamiensis TaxID=467093 RepID=UPI00034DD25D|nr:protein translocase subunit SecD [Ilumatobacter nonamiensis]
MKRRLWSSLLATTIVILGVFIANLATGTAPLLGLDLQGGASVILEPADDASGEDLTVVRDLIRDELERTGIAEPNVRVQGETIVVELPGVKDQQQALDAVDVSGIVELRPVVEFAQCTPEEEQAAPDGVSADPTAPPTTLGVFAPEPPAEVQVPDDTVGLRPARTPDTTPSTEPVPDTVPLPDLPDDLDLSELQSPTGAELLITRDGQPLCVGPSDGTGEVFERQSAFVDNQFGFQVNVELRGGEGETTWNRLAEQCFNGTPICPRTQPGSNGQLAIVLDDVIQSAPSVNQPAFDGAVSITGEFTQSEAQDLANILNRGAFPVEMVAQESQTISPAAGQESLRASVIAGLIGVALVLAFLLAYYRWIALVIIGGMTIWGLTVYSVAALVSSATNYSLSLAGITGIIVAVGVTVDSYVVFFERMKDEIRNGRTLKNAAPRSFKMTWRTIWSADLVSVIGAAILFSLSVGSVRGFALFLGITTLCDLFVCFFFTRPAVLLLARSKFMAGRKAFGLEVVQ